MTELNYRTVTLNKICVEFSITLQLRRRNESQVNDDIIRVSLFVEQSKQFILSACTFSYDVDDFHKLWSAHKLSMLKQISQKKKYVNLIAYSLVKIFHRNGGETRRHQGFLALQNLRSETEKRKIYFRSIVFPRRLIQYGLVQTSRIRKDGVTNVRKTRTRKRDRSSYHLDVFDGNIDNFVTNPSL